MVANIDKAKDAFVEVLGQDHVFHGSNASALISAFTAVAQRVNRAANAWYELFVCPPIRSGTDHPLAVQVQNYDDSLSTSFDATGFAEEVLKVWPSEEDA